MTDQNPPRRVLVIGATGSVGRSIVDDLLDEGAAVRAMTRDPSTATLRGDAELVRGSLQDPDSIAAAAEGMDAAFLLWMGFSADGAAEVVDALARTVPHIVYLSAADLHQPADAVKEGVWKDIEDLIVASGAKWTFVRGGGFATNTLSWADQIRRGDTVRIPLPEAGRSMVDERDLAAVATRALLDPSLAGHAFSVTGPETLTQAEQIHSIGVALGRRLAVEEQPLDEARAAYTEAMGSDYAVEALAYWATLIDAPEPPADGVERALGRPARPFSEWATRHASDFGAPTTDEVAWGYAGAFRRGDVEGASAWLAEQVVRVAPLETGGRSEEVRGLEAIAANAEALNADIELHAVEVSDPLIHGDRFAIRFSFDETHVPSGRSQTTVKLSYCTVEAGRIVREEVFYFTPAHTGVAEVTA